MALQKTITNEKGITSKYHRISSVTVTKTTVTVTLLSYIDLEYRTKELVENPTEDMTYAVGTEVMILPFSAENTISYADIYVMLKDTDKFEDAEDV